MYINIYIFTHIYIHDIVYLYYMFPGPLLYPFPPWYLEPYCTMTFQEMPLWMLKPFRWVNGSRSTFFLFLDFRLVIVFVGFGNSFEVNVVCVFFGSWNGRILEPEPREFQRARWETLAANNAKWSMRFKWMVHVGEATLEGHRPSQQQLS